jgi:hypothetical protein
VIERPRGLFKAVLAAVPVGNGVAVALRHQVVDYLPEDGTQPDTTSPFFDLMMAWPVARSTMITLVGES